MAPTIPTPAPAVDPDTTLPDASPPSATKKRKRTQPQPHILHTSTHRNPPWSYFHVRLTLPFPATPPASQHLDPLTTHTLLLSPLQSYLGLTGSAIPFDILRISNMDVHLRVPREDGKSFRAALTSWMGSIEVGMVPGLDGEERGDKWGRVRCSWRVVGESGGLGRMLGDGDGAELFSVG